jgi:hypothetical protein
MANLVLAEAGLACEVIATPSRTKHTATTRVVTTMSCFRKKSTPLHVTQLIAVHISCVGKYQANQKITQEKREKIIKSKYA